MSTSPAPDLHDSRTLQILGRSSSHFTRVVQLFAQELEVPYELVPIFDLASRDPQTFAGNPALKMPVLRRSDGSQLFGAENICRAIAERAAPELARRVVWPEQLRGDVSRNAQELVWHAMAAQVQLVIGVMVGKLPAEHPYFEKGRVGFEGALQWLDAHLAEALAALPAERRISLFEGTLFCMIEHLTLRASVPLAPYPALIEFAAAFAERPAAQRTAYKFDVQPA
jgi:glutathione S-transferase